MARRPASLEHIAALSQQAGLDSQTWQHLVDEICRWVGAPSGVVFSPVQGLAEPLLAASDDAWLANLVEYEATWISQDPWIAAAQRQNRFVPSGETTLGVELVPHAEYERTAFYNDFARPAGLAQLLSLRIADGTDFSFAPVTMISLHRASGEEPFDRRHKELLAACWPHLRRGLDTHWAFRRARRFHGAVEGTLDAMAQPVWVLRADAHIDHANARARELMRSVPWLTCIGDSLRGIGDLDADILRQAIAPPPGSAARAHVANCVERGRVLRAVLRVAPLQGAEPYASAWPHAKALLSLELPPQPELAQSPQRLATQYRLTPAQQQVLERLVAGLTLDEIADEQHVARSTVRTHLRALFDKFGVRRQADLLRRALGG